LTDVIPQAQVCHTDAAMTGPAIHVLTRRFRRRQVLAGIAVTAAGAAAACTNDTIVAAPPRPGAGPQNPIEPFSLYLAAERRLRDTYAATIAKHPSLKPTLTLLLADHSEHVTAMEAIIGITPAPAPSGSPSGTASGAPAPVDPAAKAAVPATPGAAVAALRAAEKAAAARYATACLAETGNRAALLASVSACESSHLVVL
jgi:hypothetical protein